MYSLCRDWQGPKERGLSKGKGSVRGRGLMKGKGLKWREAQGGGGFCQYARDLLRRPHTPTPAHPL